LFGIAGHVYAAHCAAYSQQQHKLRRLAGRRDLDHDQVEELVERIDAERAARGLLGQLATLSERDRAVIDLVDIAGLAPQEAATALGLTPGTVRMRLMRARARLRKLSGRGAPTGQQIPAGSTITNQHRGDRND
jgi:RNA polymerase sigma-70 factor (ECF subfamily)